MDAKSNVNRRDFVSAAIGGAAGLTLGRVLSGGKQNEYSSSKNLPAVPKDSNILVPRTTVGIARCQTAADAKEMTFAEIKDTVRTAVSRAGGLKAIVKNGDRVVLKPNLMTLYINSSGEKLYPEMNGVTTDYRVTRAVAQLVRQLNPDGKVFVAESSAFQQTRPTMVALNYTREKIPEVDQFVCLEESGKYEQWTSPGLATVTLPKGVGIYPDSMKPNESPEFYMSKRYYQADVIISIPVLKNHHIAGITGAIKNVAIGSSPPNIYGTRSQLAVTKATPKYALEKWGPLIVLERSKKISHKPFYLSLWMHDYYLCKPPDFVVTDGLQGSQNGPDIPITCKQKSIEDNQMNMRVILAGRDPIAVDTVHCLAIGFDPYKVNHIVNLSAFGCADALSLRINGDPVHKIRKCFELLGGRGRESKLGRIDHPEMHIESAQVKGTNLHLCVKSGPNKINMLEVSVDGIRRDEAIVGGFENIVLDLGVAAHSVREVAVRGYDRYLQCAEQTVILWPSSALWNQSLDKEEPAEYVFGEAKPWGI
jgi:uncharacterized protein (DUF362 family)